MMKVALAFLFCFQPPNCSPKSEGNRVRRQAHDEGIPATIEVYSGLYVNEANDLAKAEEDSVYSEKVGENQKKVDGCSAHW